jgi:hypothetical protein
MSSGIRKLNYTNRQKLKLEHVAINVPQPSQLTPPVFSATLDLSTYKLPPEASVFVEAYRSTAYQRFDFGTIASPKTLTPDDRTLRDFGTAEAILFRVKVVEKVADGGAVAKILAQRDQIKPNLEGPRRSLLPFEPDPSLQHEAWRLDIDEDVGPIVKVSTVVVTDRKALSLHAAFITLASPEILRRCLTWALEDGLPDEDEWDSPRGRWIRFGCGLLRQSEPPPELADDPDASNAREEWTDEVVARFCKEHGIDRQYKKWWESQRGLTTGGAT